MGEVRFTAKEFKAFCNEFARWQERLGLTGYRVAFQHKKLDGNYAELASNLRGQIVTVSLDNDVPADCLSGADAIGSAKHEALHLLVNRLDMLARNRYSSPGEIDDAVEELIRKLERLIG